MPIPISTFSVLDKDNSQPFPCQSCACGCRTAEQCWTNCCCFTPAERFAWAEKNGVTPPWYAQRPSDKAKATDKRDSCVNVAQDSSRAILDCHESKKACCNKHPIKKDGNAVCSGKTDCCSTTASKSCGSGCLRIKVDQEEAKAVASSSKRKVVLSMYALKCQGKSSEFTLLPWTILTTNQSVVMIECEFGPARQSILSEPIPVFLKPDTPPPKLLLL
jgi:hypothetical protein